jgi:hypothetical protein
MVKLTIGHFDESKCPTTVGQKYINKKKCQNWLVQNAILVELDKGVKRPKCGSFGFW